MRTVRRRVLRGGLGAAFALAILLSFSVSAASGYEVEREHNASAPQLWRLLQEQPSIPAPEVIAAVRHDTSKALRNIRPVFPGEKRQEGPENPARQKAPVTMPDFVDPSLQTAKAAAAMQPLNASFDGVNNVDGVLPPDTNGDVSATQFVQTVNLSFAVYSKTGSLLYGPADTNTLFSGFSGVCQTTNDGDPIVQYDQLADRWVITQFALPNFPAGPFSQCVAVSTTSDATGSYYRYEFPISSTRMNDYPKLGVWPDAYYASFNDFNQNTLSFAGASVVAFQREKMLLGQPASAVKFTLGQDFYSLLPSDLDGTAVPPAGAPNAYVQMDDTAWGYPQDQLEVWKFHVDWTTPANSTFTLDSTPATAPFTQLNLGMSQPGTSVRLDTLGDRLMYRLAYRNFGDHQALVTNHSIDVGANRSGVRWYELRKTGGTWGIYQQGTYGPSDGLNRWMGSVAMDKFGNMAGGWSTSSSSTYPSILYSGRLSTDPAGTLSAESVLYSGSGSQTHPAARWGDYSSIAVDPVDDCTFWYTTEYLKTTGSAPWRTRIAAFRFPQCGPGGGGGGGPTVTSFSPTSGPVGAIVTVNGTAFTGATSVKFNGVSATQWQLNSPTRIYVRVPSGATTGPISVMTPAGTGTSPADFTVTGGGGGGPTVTSFSPTSGPVGTVVTINGTGFSGATSVTFNGISASQWLVSSSSLIYARVPGGATTGPISVTTPAGTGTSAVTFTVPGGGGGGLPTVSSFTPTGGPVGTIVTVNGTNFTGATSVQFNGVPATQWLVNSSTRIYARVPLGASTGKISVVGPGGTGTSAGNFTVP